MTILMDYAYKLHVVNYKTDAKEGEALGIACKQFPYTDRAAIHMHRYLSEAGIRYIWKAYYLYN